MTEKHGKIFSWYHYVTMQSPLSDRKCYYLYLAVSSNAVIMIAASAAKSAQQSSETVHFKSTHCGESASGAHPKEDKWNEWLNAHLSANARCIQQIWQKLKVYNKALEQIIQLHLRSNSPHCHAQTHQMVAGWHERSLSCNNYSILG